MARKRQTNRGAQGDGAGRNEVIEVVPLAEATRERYLNYALSVITSRALPDVRDGLKPVQRRILYAMWADLRVSSDSRYVKSAAVVGEVAAIHEVPLSKMLGPDRYLLFRHGEYPECAFFALEHDDVVIVGATASLCIALYAELLESPVVGAR